MKTEELLHYERMYAEIQETLGTPWLEFRHPATTGEDRKVHSHSRDRVIRKEPQGDGFQPPNEGERDL